MKTMMKTLLVATALVGAFAMSPAMAATNIDFEVGAPPYFAYTSPLTTQFAAQGVTFSGIGATGGSILDDSSFDPLFAHSGTNFLAFNTSVTSAAERLTFSTPTSSFSIFAGANTDAATFTATAYDQNGMLLATLVRAVATAGTYSQLSFDPTLNISRVDLISTASVFAYDDLSFGASVAAVPEPATWLTMLLGFGMMGATMRYRRRSTKIAIA